MSKIQAGLAGLGSFMRSFLRSFLRSFFINITGAGGPFLAFSLRGYVKNPSRAGWAEVIYEVIVEVISEVIFLRSFLDPLRDPLRTDFGLYF